MVLPECLAAKAATHKGRGHVNLFFLDPKNLRKRPGRMCDRLCGVVNSQLIAGPRQSRGMQLDRIVIVARCAIDRVYLDRSGRERSLSIIDLKLERLAHKL